MKSEISKRMNKDSIIFYISQYEAIKDDLSDEQLGRLFRALFEKELGNKVVLGNDIKIAFNFLNNQMVVDKKKYEEKCARLRENGKKGGAPKGNANARKEEKQPKQPNAKKTTLNDNENDNENDNYNIFACLEENFGITLNGTNFYKIQDLLSIFPDEVLCYAVDKCVSANVTNLNYLFGVVDNWKSSKLFTLKEIQESENKKKRTAKDVEVKRRTF